MGGCCSCLKGEADTKESEMTARASAPKGKSMSLSRKMSAPTIELEKGGMKVSGNGLALAGVCIEQDAAYWEWHIELPDGKSEDTMFGISTSKDRKFYRDLEEQDDESPQTNGTALMKKVFLEDGDTVGVAVQQSDLPMVQFLVNGEPLHELAINRFRGTVYPSIHLPAGENLKVALVLEENDFRQEPPHVRFGPVIVARAIV
eukprot:CAMPEP_0119003808 /NCGR_PEP_ID=MMETSP1176-20130426/777_1 /TAXON_ID=265551 /ORGANISM="Synedropsis recta cf, Strain CCMP1620" /LENGTH=202 /DNA_ID=CAMNT_0006955443 /DNA_START=63 /DNA_END=671 /DNA_ORIENTATION=+